MKYLVYIAVILSLNTKYVLNANDLEHFTIHLNKGWNLISIPLIPTDNDYSLITFFPDANVAFEYKDGEYKSVDFLKPGVGYWVHIDSDQTYVIWGTLLSKCLQGSQGEKGEKGDLGPMGPRGEMGPKGEQGQPGINGKNGLAPEHEWKSTSIRFKKPDGGWGHFVDLKGDKGLNGLPPDHEWNEDSIRFTKPDGTWGQIF
jgi:hypothetical protein